jgi:NO-binding membrane sensor protein with MHYT domain
VCGAGVYRISEDVFVEYRQCETVVALGFPPAEATQTLRMETHYEISQVIISFGLSFISAYNVVCFADIYRLSATLPPKYFSSPIQLILMSIALGGGAIWSMHFTGMAALELENNEEHIPLSYNVGTTLLSLIAAIVCVYIGLLISTRDRVYAKDKEEIIQMFVEDVDLEEVNIQQIRFLLLRLTFFKGVGPLCLGGVITGGGVCVMHYIGMMAQHSTDSISMEWKIGLVALSVIIAIVASTTAFWILFRLLPLFPNVESLRIVSSFIMATAVCGMHYTGMEAATYYETTTATTSSSSHHQQNGMYVGGEYLESSEAGLIAIVSSLIMNWIFSMIIQSELRSASFTRSQQLDKAKKELQVFYEKYPHDIPHEPRYSSYYSEGNKSSVVFPLTMDFKNLRRKLSGAAGVTISPETYSHRSSKAQQHPQSKERDIESSNQQHHLHLSTLPSPLPCLDPGAPVLGP